MGTEGGWNSSSWVGIDGFPSNDVLQAGIQQKVDSTGIASYVAWYEWFAPNDTSPGYVFQTNITNFGVTPGDFVDCTVQYINKGANGKYTQGQITFINRTTNESFSIVLDPPPGAQFAGNSAEWIMEAPDRGLPVAQLPLFTSVLFDDCAAYDDTYATVQPQGGSTFDIRDKNSNKLFTSARGYDNKVAIVCVGGWYGRWFAMGDPKLSGGFTLPHNTPVAAATRPPDHVNLFAVGNNGTVYTSVYTSVDSDNSPLVGDWQPLHDPNFGDGFTLPLNTPIAAVSRKPSHLDLFAVGKDGIVYTTNYDDTGGWLGHWQPLHDPNFGDGFTLPLNTPIAAVSRKPSHLDLLAVGEEGFVYFTFYDDNGGWRGKWFVLRDLTFADNFTLPSNTPIGAVSRSASHLDIFAVGRDGAVYSTFYDDDGGTRVDDAGWLGQWFRLEDSTFSDEFTLPLNTPITVISLFGTQLDLVAVGSTGTLYTTTYNDPHTT